MSKFINTKLQSESESESELESETVLGSKSELKCDTKLESKWRVRIWHWIIAMFLFIVILF